MYLLVMLFGGIVKLMILLWILVNTLIFFFVQLQIEERATSALVNCCGLLLIVFFI